MNAQEIKETSKKYVLQSWSKQAGLSAARLQLILMIIYFPVD